MARKSSTGPVARTAIDTEGKTSLGIATVEGIDADTALARLDDVELAIVKGLAAGDRWRDVAMHAGCATVREAYQIYNYRKHVRVALDAVRAQHIVLSDKRLDVLEKAMDRGLGDQATEKDVSTAVSAAVQVGRGMGIGHPSPEEHAFSEHRARTIPHQQTVSVAVHLSLDDVLRPNPPSQSDVPSLDEEMTVHVIDSTLPDTVETTQPKRAVVSSRRPRPKT